MDSVRVVVGDDVFLFRFENFEIFDLLPPKELLEASKKEREEREKEAETEREREKELERKQAAAKQLMKSPEELKAEALQQLKMAASKKARQDGNVLLKVLLLGDEGYLMLMPPSLT